MQSFTREFLDFSRNKLCVEFWPRTCKCLDALTQDQIWWRPNENSNSIGNLLLHLNGNLRQWVLGPLGRRENHRDRDSEFAQCSQLETGALRGALDAGVREFDVLLANLNPDQLAQRYEIQGRQNISGLEAIYHVVEHFAMHHGQIVYITKMLTGSDLGFYAYLSKKPQATGFRS
jgi:uncharacterized damage-inducible protein DinB